MRRRSLYDVPVSKIRIEPLLDVSLVLVLALALRGSLDRTEALSVELPGCSEGVESVLTVSVAADSQLYIDAEPAAWATLPHAAKQFARRSAWPRAVVVSDPRASHGLFVRVLRVLRDAGIERVGVVADPRTATSGERAPPDGQRPRAPLNAVSTPGVDTIGPSQVARPAPPALR